MYCIISKMHLLAAFISEDVYAAAASICCSSRCCFQQLYLHQLLLLLLMLGQVQLLLPLLMSWLDLLHAPGGACKIKFLNKFTNTGAVAKIGLVSSCWSRRGDRIWNLEWEWQGKRQGGSSSLWRRIGIGSGASSSLASVCANFQCKNVQRHLRLARCRLPEMPPPPTSTAPLPCPSPCHAMRRICAALGLFACTSFRLPSYDSDIAQRKKTSSKQTTLLRLLATSYGLLPLPYTPPSLDKPRPRCTLPCSLNTN